MMSCLITEAQQSSVARARVGAEIIHPVGTRGNGTFSAIVYQSEFVSERDDSRLIGLKNTIEFTQNRENGPLALSSIEVITQSQAYSIATEFDNTLIEKNNPERKIWVEEISVMPLRNDQETASTSDRFVMGIKLSPLSGEIVGEYHSPSPYFVTVHFN